MCAHAVATLGHRLHDRARAASEEIHDRVVVNFDPDAPAGGERRSIEVLLENGFG